MKFRVWIQVDAPDDALNIEELHNQLAQSSATLAEQLSLNFRVNEVAIGIEEIIEDAEVLDNAAAGN